MKIKDFLDKAANIAKEIEQDAEVIGPLVIRSASGLHVLNISEDVAKAIIQIIAASSQQLPK